MTHDLSPTITVTPGEVTPNMQQSNQHLSKGDELISRPSLPTDDSNLSSLQATSALLLDGEFHAKYMHWGYIVVANLQCI